MKKVFISGGSRGIGAATVLAFAKTGGHEIIFSYSNNEEAAASVADAARDLGAKVSFVRMNLCDRSSIEEGIANIFQISQHLDIVVHNAGAVADSPLFFMEEDAWDKVTQLSLNSFFFLNKAFLAGMIERKWGRIICLASVSGEAGQRGQTNYAAAKGAIIAASKSLAKEVARKGVLVNVVSPGLIETDMTASLAFANAKDLKDLIPVGRYGRPEEVAHAILFLSSDQASYINGTVLQVNGGLYT